MIITITEVTQRVASNGKDYLVVKGSNPEGKEKTYKVFDNLIEGWSLLVEGAAIDFTLEKKGDYWNVTGFKPAEGKPTAQPPKPESTKSTQGGDTRDRAVALSYAKDLACHGKIELGDMRKYADGFLDYILG